VAETKAEQEYHGAGGKSCIRFINRHVWPLFRLPGRQYWTAARRDL